MNRLGVILSTVVSVAIVFAIFTSSVLAQVAPASTDISEPVVPPGWVNLFAGFAAGEPIRAGMKLPADCWIVSVDLAGGYFNRATNVKVAIGDGVVSVLMQCIDYISGKVVDIDNDPKEGEVGHRWTFNNKYNWVPDVGFADKSQEHRFESVRLFLFEFGGDSGALTILVDGTATPTPTATPTASATPSATATPPQGDDDSTPTATATATSTLDLDLDTPTPEPTLGPPTDLDQTGEPQALPSNPQLWIVWVQPGYKMSSIVADK